MICRRSLIPGIICVLLSAGAARADMVLVFKTDAEPQASSCAPSQTEALYTNLPGLYEHSVLADLHFGSIPLLHQEVVDNVEEATQTQNALELTGGPGSVSLCLYALMGLGLCSTPHWIKKSHFGHIPEWYHDGGPFQIGHSFAVSPESLCPVPAYCFIQPDDTAEEHIPQYHLRTIVSSWRKSQFTPDVIASRGPPLRSC